TLIERVWPRVIVDENNLPAQIAGLRRILGAQAIRTVPGFGYRLELPVTNMLTAVAHIPVMTPQAADPDGLAAVAIAPVPEHLRLPIARRTWPNRLGGLVGRDQELRELQDVLTRSCLVTIVGIAGVGKTRLAQE